ncbi:MAG TPA: LuxR C-terminal-related transcriptional regulator [Catalimonadaceae bacterium]|nr:LuxR C-terminal-related transcriptional regulator [Catalimonadaceae bacterium]
MGIPYLFSFIEKDNGPKANSDFKLTDRELEIPGLLVKEISCKMIADKCILSIPTVNTHINHIYEKRRLNFEGAAMVMALEKKIL